MPVQCLLQLVEHKHVSSPLQQCRPYTLNCFLRQICVFPAAAYRALLRQRATCACAYMCNMLAAPARRAQFVPQMVNGLMKLGLPQNASLENRRLSLDLAGLVVHWELQRIAEATGSPPCYGAPCMPCIHVAHWWASVDLALFKELGNMQLCCIKSAPQL